MIIHVLPGDAQVETFKETDIEGEIAVCREALVDGPVNAADPDDLWKMRAEFLGGTYLESAVPEFEKLLNAPDDAEINLWFEYELFCQVNMWFCLWLLRNSSALVVYRVEPATLSTEDRWNGFGRMSEGDMQQCFSNRRLFTNGDIAHGAALWEAYRSGNYLRLLELSKMGSECFPYLEEVCQAAAEKDNKPKQLLKKIITEGFTDFKDIFPEFRKQAGVYGYGDTQVKAILNEL